MILLINQSIDHFINQSMKRTSFLRNYLANFSFFTLLFDKQVFVLINSFMFFDSKKRTGTRISTNHGLKEILGVFDDYFKPISDL